MVDHQRIINLCRVQELLYRSDKKLHQIFLKKWERCTHQSWINGTECGNQLIELFEKSDFTITNVIRGKISEGVPDEWDITISYIVIQVVNQQIRKNGCTMDRSLDKQINILREIRNYIEHKNNGLSDKRCETTWNKLTEVLVALGEDKVEIEKLKHELQSLGKPEKQQSQNCLMIEEHVSKETSQVIKTAIKKDETQPAPIKKVSPEFVKLNTEANKLFKNKKYTEAINAYTQMLQLPNLSSKDEATIFSCRSEAYLMIGNDIAFELAKTNADYAVKIWPSWWKGYYKLGRALKELHKFEEAEKALDIANALNPRVKEVFDELSEVRAKIGALKRQEHLNLEYYCPNNEKDMEEIGQKYGLDKNTINKTIKKLEKTPIFKDIIMGHNYRDGRGVKQDYALAAEHYTIAANQGDPEGMYNLGWMYLHGKGVKVDYCEAMKWFLKTANSPITSAKRGSSIPQSRAQHTIGLMYREGTGVEKDFKEAVKWYEKAVENSYGPSANNLGLLYQNGQGVEQSNKKAFEYFKLGSYWSDTNAMCNLAGCYLYARGTEYSMPNKDGLAEAKRWLGFAASKGNLNAKADLKTFENTNDTEVLRSIMNTDMPPDENKADPLNKEQHLPAIKEAAMKGSVTAQNHLDIWKHMGNAAEAFKRNDSATVIAELAKAVRINPQIIDIPNFYHLMIMERYKSYPNEADATVCYLAISIKNSKLLSATEHFERFSKDKCITELVISWHIIVGKFKRAEFIAEKALKRYPNDVQLLYVHATSIAQQADINGATKCIKALEKFIEHAPIDHDKVPACYYRKAAFYLSTKNYSKFIEAFEVGLAAEKNQLLCFLPYYYHRKSTLERMYEMHKNMNNANISIASQPQFTMSLLKKMLLKRLYAGFIHFEKQQREKKILNPIKNLPNIPKAPRLTDLKKIFIRDMNPTLDKTYDGCFLTGRIVSWPYAVIDIIFVAIEDEKCDVQRLAIYNWPSKNDHAEDMTNAMKTFKIGSFIFIINPYMRIANDDMPLIRAENPGYISFDDTDSKNICHCCGKKIIDLLECPMCMLGKYCSKECQTLDWNELNHQQICDLLIKYS